MALEVWLMRHGEAENADRSGSDAERGLTERGRRQVAALGRWLLERTEAPQLILHSPLKRARETAEALSQGIPLAEESALAPGMCADSLLNVLNQQGLSRIVCVGHQPDIGQCLGKWTGGRVQIPPGTLALVRFQLIAADSGALSGLLDPAWFSDR